MSKGQSRRFTGVAPKRAPDLWAEAMFLRKALLFNHLLAALPVPVLERLSPHLEGGELKWGDVLSGENPPSLYAHFPTSALVSLHGLFKKRGTSEISEVSCEGAHWRGIFAGPFAPKPRHRSKGREWVSHQNRSFVRGIQPAGRTSVGALHQGILGYTTALLTQISKLSMCARNHSLEQQLCRWLLSTLDRLPPPAN